jgi:hypothetical protein
MGSLLKAGESHPALLLGALQAGGSFLTGMTSTLTPAQVAAYNAQAAANQATANLTTQQTANLAAPRSVANVAPVTGTPSNIITAPPAGMINSAPTVKVTGTTS